MKAIGPEDSASAAVSFKRTKKFAPTRYVISRSTCRTFGLTQRHRAHPGAPDKPPFETLAGLMAAPVDKLKDMFAQFPSQEEKDAASKN